MTSSLSSLRSGSTWCAARGGTCEPEPALVSLVVLPINPSTTALFRVPSHCVCRIPQAG